MKVYLIRHAKSKDSVKGLHQRDNSPVANIESIDKTAFAHLEPDKVYSSPLTRARQTAEAIFNEFEIIDYLYEYHRPALLTGKSRTEGEQFWMVHLNDMRSNPDWKYDGSESFREIVNRAMRFYKFLETLPYARVAVVGHGLFFRHLFGVIKYGTGYSFADYENETGIIDWKSLEVKEIEI